MWHSRHKVAFPLREFGFPADVCVPYSKGWIPGVRSCAVCWKNGEFATSSCSDFIIPTGLPSKARDLGIEAWVFELGYLRPNYVTERDRVNARSNLNKPAAFYRGLPECDQLPQNIVLDPGWRWRKAWKRRPSFNTLSPDTQLSKVSTMTSPGFSGAGARHLALLALPLAKRLLKQRLLEHFSFFLAVLQVSSDSQIQMGSPYRGMHDFIEDVIDPLLVMPMLQTI